MSEQPTQPAQPFGWYHPSGEFVRCDPENEDTLDFSHAGDGKWIPLHAAPQADRLDAERLEIGQALLAWLDSPTANARTPVTSHMIRRAAQLLIIGAERTVAERYDAARKGEK